MKNVAALVQQLEDGNEDTGNAAARALAKLPPDALAEHAPAIAKRLEDDGYDEDTGEYPVREAAVEALAKLPPEALVAA